MSCRAVSCQSSQAPGAMAAPGPAFLLPATAAARAAAAGFLWHASCSCNMTAGAFRSTAAAPLSARPPATAATAEPTQPRTHLALATPCPRHRPLQPLPLQLQAFHDSSCQVGGRIGT
mgnify:CR=1 FL=1